MEEFVNLHIYDDDNVPEIIEINRLLKKWNVKRCKNFRKINKFKIPVTRLEPTNENAHDINTFVECCEKLDLRPCYLTKSGGISTSNYIISPRCSFLSSKTGCEILFTTYYEAFRIQFGCKLPTDDDGNSMSGHKAFLIFNSLCKKFNIDMSKYAISKEEGQEVKKTIDKPYIKYGDSINETTKLITRRNVHHIDIHNSYPAGLAETHPEFKDLINMLYEKRKEDPINKAVLNLTVGYMQSQYCGFRYAQLSKDAIHVNTLKIDKLSEELTNSGRKVLLYNTDGIWYQGDIYHGENEGPNLGQWHNDHTNCQFRMKSPGAYEFIEDNKYHPVVRGKTKLDMIKSRDQWEWGDIFKAVEIKYQIKDNRIVNEEGVIY